MMSQSSISSSKRVKGIQPSPTLAVDTRAKDLAQQGVDIVNLGVGEPDYNTPDHIKEAAMKAIRDNQTRYTAAVGIAELRKAVVEKLKRENGLEYSPDQVVVSNGAKHSLYNCLQAICNDGDEVLIPAPYWVSYPEHVRMAGGVPVEIPAMEDTAFKVTSELLEKHTTDRTKALFLNSPNNPSGAAYTREDLEDLAEFLVDRNIAVVSDEVYEHLVYDGRSHVSIASLGEEMKELTLVVNAVSKSYAMTGWRIGYVAGPAGIVKAMGSLQSHATSNPATISQWAAVAALSGPQDVLREMVTEYAWRREYVYERVKAMPHLVADRPEGAFYIFPNIAQLVGKTIGDTVISGGLDLAGILLEEAGVAVVPGEAFGSPQNIRISYATSRENLKKGFDLIEDLVSQAR